MRIVFYSQSSTVYGSPASLVNLVGSLQKIDPALNMLVVIPHKGALEKKLEQEKVPYKIVPHSKWVYNNNIYQRKLKESRLLAYLWLTKNVLQRHFKNLKSRAAHDQLIKEFKPDLVYVNSSIAPMGPWIAVHNKLPFIWHHRETVNDPLTGFYLDNTNAFRKYFPKADLHLHPSEFLKDQYLLYPGSNHKVIYNGVPDAPHNTPNRSSGDPIRFGMVGRINHQKGQREVLEVFKGLPQGLRDYELHLFGSGPSTIVNELKQEFSDRRVLFRGFQETSVIYEELDYLIVSGRNESFGRVVAEANARGIPVIACDSGALSEIVKEGQNGLLYQTSKGLSLYVQQLLGELPKGYYQAFSKRARESYEKNFSIDRCALNVYQELIQFRSQSGVEPTFQVLS